MKRGERRKRRSWKSTKRRAKNTKRNTGKVRRRKRRRGNKNRLPPRRPAPVNRQTVTETHLWHRAQGIPLLSSIPWREDGGLQTLWEHGTRPRPAQVSFTRTEIYKGAFAPRVDTAMKVKNVLQRAAHKAKELVPIYYFIFLPDPLSLHIWYLLCADELWWRMVHWLSSSWKNAVVVGFHTLSFEFWPFLHFYHCVLLNWIMWEQISFYCFNLYSIFVLKSVNIRHLAVVAL